MIEKLERLAGVLEAMDPGHRFDLQYRGFESLWPNPRYPLADDHLQPRERAEKWCAFFGCTIHQQFDPPALVIMKKRMVEPEFRGFMPARPTIDEDTRADLRAFFAEKRK